MPKQTVPWIYLIPCCSKLSAFLEIFFQRNLLFPASFENVSFSQWKMFDIPLLINLFISLLKENPLKASHKRTHIPLLINQFVSSVELRCSDWMNTWKFKIDKITSWKLQLRTTYARLYKLLESGNGTKISDEKWRLVKSKYLENKNW